MNKEGQDSLGEKSRLGWFEACERCRRRHIRCRRKSGHLPCNNCKKAKTKCTGGKRDVFRAVHYSSESGSVVTTRSQEPTTPSSQPCLVESVAADGQPTPSYDSTPATESLQQFRTSLGSSTLNNYPDAELAHSDPANNSTSDNHNEYTPHDLGQPSLSQLDTQEIAIQCFDQTSTLFDRLLSSTSQDSVFWPLQTEFEASLFQHFITELSPWFDYCDPQNHFRNHVANAAATDRTLLYAIFAVSARHRSDSSTRSLVFAEELQQHCLSSLICALNDYDTTVEENVFASALILRLIEEMTVPHPGSNIVSHTLSAQLLIRIKAGNIRETKFTDAAFLVTLRQEIFMSNMMQRPVGSVAEHCNIDTSLSSASDPTWAHRAIALAAKVTDFAYGPNEYRTKEQWEFLMQYLHDWERRRPHSFRPIFNGGGESATSADFPRLLFCSDYHVAASQYTELSRILLLASDPSACQIRIGRLVQRRNHEDAIRQSVRLICGVALANRQYMPTRSTAGLVISMCGELFSDRNETKVLLGLLTEAESHLGWPCLKLKDELKQLWKLDDHE